MKNLSLTQHLDSYYQEIKAVILNRQNPISGLLPASTAITAHGDYTDAWVRDNVYSVLAVWGLAIAYRKLDHDHGRTFELEHSVIKLMRGLLFAMMKQSQKVEKFKETQAPLDSLHAKYNTNTGDIVVGDDQWGHLQLDATSLFILMLAEMTASGLNIIYTIDEVNFVQNLVYYIGRTYRTPDFGLWERGNKINRGTTELNASSIGMAKAALEAINGIDLFGIRGSQASVIHVLNDEIARARITLESLLPRESGSKETDSALLSIISYPAFAIENQEIVQQTKQKIIEKLQGKYGCKRFLKDGHQTVIEDHTRLHYEPSEMQQFADIECEWPLFFTYLLLDGIFTANQAQVREYLEKLEFTLVTRNGYFLLPELYYVPAEKIADEKAHPHSQTRLPNDNIPLVWAQSLYYLGKMLVDELISPGDLDPLGRHLRIGKKRNPVVQIALIAEDEDLQNKLADQGIATQTPTQIQPITIRKARELSLAYTQIGRNDKLGLTGRPVRRLRTLTTSKVFKIKGEYIIFLPSFLDQSQFYLTIDYHFLVAQIKAELGYIQRHWAEIGRPTMTLFLTHTMLEHEQQAVLELIKQLLLGEWEGVEIKLGRIQELIRTAAVERIDFLHDFQFTENAVQDAVTAAYYLVSKPENNHPLTNREEFLLECETNPELLLKKLHNSVNIYEQIEILHALYRLEGLEFFTGFAQELKSVTVRDLLHEIYLQSGQQKLWNVVRHAAGLLAQVDIGLSDAVTDILIKGKQISVGKSYSKDSLINQPMSYTEIIDKIKYFCGEDIRDRVLTQEIILYLGVLIKAEPLLFKNALTLKVGYLILLITTELARELKVTQDEAYEQLMQLSPFEIKTRLRQVLSEYEGKNQVLFNQESLHINQEQNKINWLIFSNNENTEKQPESWLRQRQKNGALNLVPENFYPSVWRLMEHSKGLIIGDKLERRNRVDSNVILSEMTAGERNFFLWIEHLLNKIPAPEYRQLNIEALMALSVLTDYNQDLQIKDYLVLDVIIGHAVRLAWFDPKQKKIFVSKQEQNPLNPQNYDYYKASAWRTFYESSPHTCATYIVKSLQFLTELGLSAI
jgi:phosphorylase kinase alpha/beta subunit